MPKLKKDADETVEINENDAVAVDEVEETDDTNEDYALSNMLAELRGSENSSGSIYRQPLHGKKLEFIFSFMVDEYDSLGKLCEKIQYDYGGGTYRIQVRKDGRLVINRPVLIASPIIKKDRDNNDSIKVIADLIKEQNTEFKNIFMMLMTKMGGNQSQINPLEMQKSMMDSMVQMKTFLSDGQPVQNTDSQIDFVLKGIELAKELNHTQGESNTTDVMLELLKTFGKPIADITSKLSATNKANSQLPGPSPKHESAPDSQPKGDLTMLDSGVASKLYLNYLIAQAKKDSDPALYADLIIDNMPINDIRNFINNPDALGQLTRIDDRVGLYQDWFAKLKNELNNIFLCDDSMPEKSSLTDEPESAINLNDAIIQSATSNSNNDGRSERAGGDTCDVKNNEEISAERQV